MLNKHLLVFFVPFLFVCALSARATDLIARWPLDKNLKDVVGKHDGNMQGGNPLWVQGKFAEGLELRGPNQYVEVQKSKDLELETVTLIAWVNFKGVAGRQEVVSYADSYGIFMEGGVFRALLFNGADWVVVNGATPVKAGEWFHVAQVVGKKEMKLYVNGNLDAQQATPSIAYQNFAMWFGGGPADNSFWLTGILDEIEVWNGVLTDTEIAQLFKQPPAAAVRPEGKAATVWARLKRAGE